MHPAVARPAGTFVVTTNTYTFGQAPDWTPDGRVVFNDDFGDGMQIYEAKLDGSGRRCLTCELPGPNMVPTMRPQGDKIMFHSYQGHMLTVGAPGFGGLGSNVYVMNADGSHVVALTADSEGQDNFHAYWSPDGRHIVWTHLNWNFITSNGNGKSDVRVADYVDDARGGHLANIRVVKPANGHWYETQHWAPDGSGFLYTESYDNAMNNELFFMNTRSGHITRLTNDPAWDEQAIFTPDMRKVIFMSTRDHPSLWQTWANASWSAGVPADLDYALVLPLFEVGFLQPIAPAATDLYEVTLATGAVRRLTHDGDDGWIIPEFAWDRAGERLLWTELKIVDGARVSLPLDPARQGAQLGGLLLNPPVPGPGATDKGRPGFEIVQRTRIGTYRP